MPMIAELLDGRSATGVLVGVGPGSFTGIRVGIAAAHGLAIGWNAQIAGMSSLALLAASAGEPVAVAVLGGHGELFVQEFDELRRPLAPVQNLKPNDAAAATRSQLVLGSGAQVLVETRGWGEAREIWPSATNSLRLPERLRALAPKPFYGRPPDARAREAA
jgi:tRNA threonylcarbamoyl adenosine modification protein YeaZ